MFIVEGQSAAEEGVENDAAAPHVHLRPRVQFGGDHFRGSVIWGPAAGTKELSVHHDVRKPWGKEFK